VTASKTTGPIEATSAARSLVIYRTRLADLLARAEIVAQDESSEIHLAVSALVDRLSCDLVRLYDDLERGALAQSDRVIVLPALEFMREVLRHSYSRPRSIRDALSKALAPIPRSPP
jgi:hypothetical protein